MFESLIVTLREGIEAALILGIILIFLRRTGRERLTRWVFWGLGTAAVASVAGAALLSRLPLDEEATEGVLMLVAAAFIVTVVVWMWRTAREMKGEIEGRLERLAERGDGAAGWGLFGLTFVLIFREGAETVLLLAAVGLNTRGLLSILGAVLGLALAVVFGVALIRGSIRIDLARFFRITSVVLLVFAANLLAGALHEFAEAGVIPIGRDAMRILGPIVKGQGIVLAAALALPVLLVLSPGAKHAAPMPAEGPERRLLLARARRERRWRTVAGGAALAGIVLLTVSMTTSRFPTTVEPPVMLTAEGGRVRLPAAGLDDGHLHRFGVDLDGVTVRFLAVKSGGELHTAFDACQVCGARGYIQRHSQIVCLACAADINPATIGAAGGCNPLPLAFARQGDALVIRVEDLAASRDLFRILDPPGSPGAR